MRQPPILIVDDNPQNIQIAAQTLESEGYPLAFALSGEQALAQVEHIIPDLILLDVMMPGMDGFTVCQALKANPKTSDIPVIFLTAKSDEDSIAHGFEVGGIDYITKPFLAAEMQARVKTHLALRHALTSLSQANQTKDRFFSIISHDLKGPFNGLLGLSDILLSDFEKLDKPQLLPLIEGLSHSAHSGFTLLNQLLEWAKTQTGRIEYTPQPIDMLALIQQTIGLLDESAEQKQIQWSHQLPDTLNTIGDYNMIQTVLRNLLSNALKFTPRHGQVGVGAKQEGKTWLFWVYDTGMGINQKKQDRLFKPESKFSTQGTEGEEGTGFGLLLCREFLEIHQQKIWVESEPGRGSKFFFRLPAP